MPNIFLLESPSPKFQLLFVLQLILFSLPVQMWKRNWALAYQSTLRLTFQEVRGEALKAQPEGDCLPPEVHHSDVSSGKKKSISRFRNLIFLFSIFPRRFLKNSTKISVHPYCAANRSLCGFLFWF